MSRLKKNGWLSGVVVGTACLMTCVEPVSAADTAVPASAAVSDLLSPGIIWLLLAAFVAMFVHVGLAMIDTGLCRAKNSSHTVAMNLLVFPLSCLAFWAYGFALGWGNWSTGASAPGWRSVLGLTDGFLNRGAGFGRIVDDAGKATGGFAYGLFGTKGLCLSGGEQAGLLAFFFFMWVLLDKAATIPAGAMAERWRWKNFCLYGLWVALPYSIYANWVWGGGWLAQAGVNWHLGHGAVDFAGSGVIHAMGGIIALAGAWLIGPRTGKYRGGHPQPLPGHHVPMVVLGSLIAACGWFGLNSGFALGGIDVRLGSVVVNTALAAAAGTLASMLTLWGKKMKPDPTLMCNGLLAGLVAISAPCGFVDAWAAVLIGAIAGVVVVFSVLFWERRGLDDPVGAISVHGVGGLWGLIAVGIFATGKYGAAWNGVVRQEFVAKYGSDGVRGMLYGDPLQLVIQLISAIVLVIFGLAVAVVLFKLSTFVTPLRVSRDVELEGLDGPEMGSLGYPDFTLTRHT